MNKLYLTPSETRRYAVELPVGDPWSGPAFGTKTMPVVAIAMAATSFAGGMAAFSAATTLGGMIAAGATMVGSALTIVGTITGNSKLAKIGGILTLGGALAGGIANPFGGAEAATETAATTAGVEAAAQTGGEAINQASHFSDAAFEAGLPSAASAAPNAAQAASSARGLINANPIQELGPMTDVQSQAVVDTANATSAANAPMQNTSMPFDTGGANALDAGSTQVGQAVQGDAFNAGDIIQNARGEAHGLINDPAENTAGGYFDRFGRWVKNNKELAYMGTTFASGLLPSQRDRAATEAYQQQAEANRRRALWATGRTQ